ncbi:MAG: GDSL-type esterase/lipase family protein [Bacteroidales bacterium]|jgi:lysophospholipase L1-like esterase|nr:GDSL-type esterase/lipase family protein [Bacteroidales bacterium]
MNGTKHIGITYFFAILTQFVGAQTCEQHEHSYPFLRCGDNEIKHKGRSSEKFEFFYEKLLKLQVHGTGCLNILHFGDSHIQADHLPNRMRQLLLGDQTAWSEGDRGVIFPFTVAKTNNPHSYIVDYSGEWSSVRNVKSDGSENLGLTGMSISTSDPSAMLKITQPQTGYVTSSFTSIRVFHSVGQNVPKILLGQSDNLMFQTTNESRGYTLFGLKESMDSLSIVFDFNFVELASSVEKNATQEISIYGISLESGNAGSTYSALGVNGARVKDLLKSNLLEKQLSVVEPSLIILSYGTNDVYQNFNPSEFRKNYTTLIRRIRSELPHVPILLTTPGDALKDRTQPIKELPQLIKIIHDVAKANDCAVWDFYTVMGGKGSINEWFQANLANSDNLHFIKKGYELQADLLFQALIQNYLNTIKN